jgi:hypothetical protein
MTAIRNICQSRLGRFTLANLGFPLTVVGSFTLMCMLRDGGGWAPFILFLIPLVIYGAFASRVWTLVLPFVWSWIFVAILVITGCTACGITPDWNYLMPWVLYLYVPAMTVAVGLGLIIGKSIRGGGINERLDNVS